MTLSTHVKVTTMFGLEVLLSGHKLHIQREEFTSLNCHELC